METQNQTAPGTGSLILSVRTAGGAVPLEGALVTLRRGSEEGFPDGRWDGSFGSSDSSGELIAAFLTDRSGQTPRIDLPAPPRSLSQSPGPVRPYALYSAEVSLDGYYAATYSDIPVFDGVTSVQSVMMIPLPEFGTDRREILDYGGPREEVLRDGIPAREGGGTGSLDPDGRRTDGENGEDGHE